MEQFYEEIETKSDIKKQMRNSDKGRFKSWIKNTMF